MLSGLNDAFITIFVCPFSSIRGVPVRASQTFAELSELAVTIRMPSGLNDALQKSALLPRVYNPPRVSRFR